MKEKMQEFLSKTLDTLKTFNEQQRKSDMLEAFLVVIILEFEKQILDSGVIIKENIVVSVPDPNLKSPIFYVQWDKLLSVKKHLKLHKRQDSSGFSYKQENH